MKKNINIMELVEELKTEASKKFDFVISAKKLSFLDGVLCTKDLKRFSQAKKEITEMVEQRKLKDEDPANYDTLSSFLTTENFDNQICDKLQIPRAYFQRMTEKPNLQLLDHNVSHWLDQSTENFLVRTFINEADPSKNIARAFLSSSFKMIDNFDILMTALDAVRASGVELKIESCDLSDKKMYVRFIAPSVEIQAPELLKDYKVPGTSGTSGDHGILAGFVLTNSETGHGAFSITPRIMIKACSNGMIAKRDSLRKIHVGGKMAESEIKWSEETTLKQMELVQLQIRDAVQTFITPEYVGKAADYILQSQKELEHPIDACKNVTKELAYDEKSSDAILNYFIKSGDLSSFGVAQAVTFYAGKDADPDQRFEMESQAFELVEIAANNDKPFIEAPSRRKSNKGFSNN